MAEGALCNVWVCDTDHSQLKSDYTIVKAVREASGFGWNDIKKMPTAAKDVWDRYITVRPLPIIHLC